MGGLLSGAMVGCSKGETTASAELTCEMGARCAGVVCTDTTGSFSFSSLLQPLARQSIAAIAQKRNVAPRRDAKAVIIVGVMELSEPPSAFANWPGLRDSAGLRLGRRRWFGRRWSAHQRPPALLLRRLCSGAS